jgi:two-component system NtrC family sensor kinase
VVAHEINNPLASVVTYAKLLLRRCTERQPMTEDCRQSLQYLDAIASESTRCGEIVSNLLLFARKTGSRFEPADTNELARKALFLIKHKADLARVEMVEELAPDLPRVLCDPGQLQQALLALCINGVEAMAEGGKLTVGSRAATGGGVRLTVSDTGVGMSPEVRAHIFEPFFTTKDEGEGKGLGLGLAVVYGIVQRHGGAINVESVPGQGTTFTLELPPRPPQSSEENA